MKLPSDASIRGQSALISESTASKRIDATMFFTLVRNELRNVRIFAAVGGDHRGIDDRCNVGRDGTNSIITKRVDNHVAAVIAARTPITNAAVLHFGSVIRTRRKVRRRTI